MATYDDHEALKAQVVQALSAPGSPARRIGELDDLIVRHEQIEQQIQRLQSRENTVREVLSRAENAARDLADAEEVLLRERKSLAGLAGDLGQSAFCARLRGDIPKSPAFAQREELQDKIERLRQQKDGLAAENPTGFLEQSKKQARMLKVIGQIKIEELRVPAADKAIGMALLATRSLEGMVCASTKPVLDAIKQQQSRVQAASEKCEKLRTVLSDVIQSAGDTAGHEGSISIESLRRESRDVTKQRNERQRDAAQVAETLLESAIHNPELRNIPQFAKALKELSQCHRIVPARSVPIFGGLTKTITSCTQARTAVLSRYSTLAVFSVFLLGLCGIYGLSRLVARPTAVESVRGSNSVSTSVAAGSKAPSPQVKSPPALGEESRAFDWKGKPKRPKSTSFTYTIEGKEFQGHTQVEKEHGKEVESVFRCKDGEDCGAATIHWGDNTVVSGMLGFDGSRLVAGPGLGGMWITIAFKVIPSDDLARSEGKRLASSVLSKRLYSRIDGKSTVCTIGARCFDPNHGYRGPFFFGKRASLVAPDDLVLSIEERGRRRFDSGRPVKVTRAVATDELTYGSFSPGEFWSVCRDLPSEQNPEQFQLVVDGRRYILDTSAKQVLLLTAQATGLVRYALGYVKDAVPSVGVQR